MRGPSWLGRISSAVAQSAATSEQDPDGDFKARSGAICDGADAWNSGLLQFDRLVCPRSRPAPFPRSCARLGARRDRNQELYRGRDRCWSRLRGCRPVSRCRVVERFTSKGRDRSAVLSTSVAPIRNARGGHAAAMIGAGTRASHPLTGQHPRDRRIHGRWANRSEAEA